MKMARHILEQEFATDHRELTRGFARLLELLESGDDEAARRLADHIDQIAGPHIEFEETVLYPEVARSEGRDFAASLYSEHRTAFEAISWLLSHSGEATIGEETRRQLIDQVQTGLDHAVSCGSLMAHLTSLDDEQQEKFLQQLRFCRDSGRRWSERRLQNQ